MHLNNINSLHKVDSKTTRKNIQVENIKILKSKKKHVKLLHKKSKNCYWELLRKTEKMQRLYDVHSLEVTILRG